MWEKVLIGTKKEVLMSNAFFSWVYTCRNILKICQIFVHAKLSVSVKWWRALYGTKNLLKNRCFSLVFANFGLCGLLPTQLNVKPPYLGLSKLLSVETFGFVTVTGSLCRSVELIQHVTVTGVCQIDRNGTVLGRPEMLKSKPTHTECLSQLEMVVSGINCIGE